MKTRDALLCEEAKVVSFARLVGYNEIGEAIEITYDPKTNSYDWHIAGECVGEASQQSIEQFIPKTQ